MFWLSFTARCFTFFELLLGYPEGKLFIIKVLVSQSTWSMLISGRPLSSSLGEICRWCKWVQLSSSHWRSYNDVRQLNLGPIVQTYNKRQSLPHTDHLHSIHSFPLLPLAPGPTTGVLRNELWFLACHFSSDNSGLIQTEVTDLPFRLPASIFILNGFSYRQSSQ